VVGACTSGHDVSKDLADHGIDVTMYQRSSTYVMSVTEGVRLVFGGLYYEGGPSPDVADRLNASLPIYLQKPLHQRIVKDIADKDRETLDGLRRVGFRVNTGIDGTGFLLLVWTKASGYYFDVGASQMIIDGKIKLKNDAQISRLPRTAWSSRMGARSTRILWYSPLALEKRETRCAKYSDQRLAPISSQSGVWTQRARYRVHGAI